MDAAIAAFEAHLAEAVRRATARVTGALQRTLGITDGVIDRTAGNNRIIRRLDALFEKEMEDAGYGHLVEAFVKQFPSQLIFVRDELQLLHEQIAQIPAQLTLTASDLATLSSFQLNAVQALESSVEGSGGVAMRGLMLTIGSMQFSDLAESISEKFSASIPRAVSLADTALATFYRVAQSNVYEMIGRETPEIEQRYKYFGPLDVKTRTFCTGLLEADATYTRSMIDEMDNGQIPNVWLSCGGINCRHRWRLYFDPAEVRRQAA